MTIIISYKGAISIFQYYSLISKLALVKLVVFSFLLFFEIAHAKLPGGSLNKEPKYMFVEKCTSNKSAQNPNATPFDDQKYAAEAQVANSEGKTSAQKRSLVDGHNQQCNLQVVFEEATSAIEVHRMYAERLQWVIEGEKPQTDVEPTVKTGYKNSAFAYNELFKTQQVKDKNGNVVPQTKVAESDFSEIAENYCGCNKAFSQRVSQPVAPGGSKNSVCDQNRTECERCCVLRVRREKLNADLYAREETLKYNQSRRDLISSDDKTLGYAKGTNRPAQTSILNDYYQMAFPDPQRTPPPANPTPQDSLVYSETLDPKGYQQQEAALEENGFKVHAADVESVDNAKIAQELDLQDGLEVRDRGGTEDVNLSRKLERADDKNQLKKSYQADRKVAEDRLRQAASNPQSKGQFELSLKKGSADYRFFQFIMDSLNKELIAKQTKENGGKPPVGPKQGLANTAPDKKIGITRSISTKQNQPAPAPSGGNPNQQSNQTLDEEIGKGLSVSPSSLIDPNVNQ